MSMPANEIIKKAMARCGLSKNSVLDPFNTTDQMVNEFVDAANSLLADLATDNEFSILLKDCDFNTYQTWQGPTVINEGQSVLSTTSSGKIVRFRAQNTGESEYAPDGEGVFTMNPNPAWQSDYPVSLNTRMLSDNAEWKAMSAGTTGTLPPEALGANRVKGFQVSDGSITWVFEREVLYWKNMGNPNFYPFNEICPDFSYISQNTVIDKTQNRRMNYIDDQLWQLKKAINVTDGYAHFYTMNRGGLVLFPTYPENDQISFKYFSNNVVLDAEGNEKAQFDTASDTCLFPDWLIIFGTAMRWFQSKKIDASAEEANFKKQRDRFIAQTKTGDSIRLDGFPSSDLRSVPAGGWEIGG